MNRTYEKIFCVISKVFKTRYTRKEALERAIGIIEASNYWEKTYDNEELINVLKELKEDYPYWKLTQVMIIDMVEQYRFDHNRDLPHVCDFNGKVLPSPSVIKRIFPVEKISDFLEEVFPQRNNADNLMYNGRSHREWLDEFIPLYLKFEKSSISLRAKDYEKNKPKGVPDIKTLYRWFGISNYNQLLTLCGLKENRHIKVNIVNAEDITALLSLFILIVILNNNYYILMIS